MFLSQGTDDKAVALGGFDVVRAELTARGRDVTAERLPGVDHSYNSAGAPPGGPPDGIRAALKRVVDWFVGEPASRPDDDKH